MHVTEKGQGILAVDDFSDESIDSDSFAEFCVFLGAGSEEFGEDQEVHVGVTGFADKIFAHVKRCGVGVVETEAVENAGHLLDVELHSLPEIGTVFFAGTVT